MKEILTVSQLNDNIKFLLEETFGFVWVEGEVSNLRRPQSGHVYFTLKDDKSQIRTVYFRQFGRSKQGSGFELEEGLMVLCRARLSVYPPRDCVAIILYYFVEKRGLLKLRITNYFENLGVKPFLKISFFSLFSNCDTVSARGISACCRIYGTEGRWISAEGF
jgi:exonuclease VII large subunit